MYTYLSKAFCEPVFDAFEKEGWGEVLAIYDSEATRTKGPANRLIVEKDCP